VAKLAPPPSPGSITVLVFVNIINPNYASSFFLFCKYFVVAHLVTWININVFNIYTPFFLERIQLSLFDELNNFKFDQIYKVLILISSNRFSMKYIK